MPNLSHSRASFMSDNLIPRNARKIASGEAFTTIAIGSQN
jgi:hypothetical protein